MCCLRYISTLVNSVSEMPHFNSHVLNLFYLLLCTQTYTSKKIRKCVCERERDRVWEWESFVQRACRGQTTVVHVAVIELVSLPLRAWCILKMLHLDVRGWCPLRWIVILPLPAFRAQQTGECAAANTTQRSAKLIQNDIGGIDSVLISILTKIHYLNVPIHYIIYTIIISASSWCDCNMLAYVVNKITVLVCYTAWSFCSPVRQTLLTTSLYFSQQSKSGS